MTDHSRNQPHPPEPEQPRQEPEIIPPDGRPRRDQGFDPRARVFVYMDRDGNTRRMNVSPPGPLTIILILVAIAIIAATIFALVLGALVFLLPIAAIALVALVGYAYARGAWMRWRSR